MLDVHHVPASNGMQCCIRHYLPRWLLQVLYAKERQVIMAKGYPRSSHMSGGYPECGTKLFQTPNRSGGGGSGPNYVPSHDYGKACKAEHMPRTSGSYSFPGVKLAKGYSGNRIGKGK